MLPFLCGREHGTCTFQCSSCIYDRYTPGVPNVLHNRTRWIGHHTCMWLHDTFISETIMIYLIAIDVNVLKQHIANKKDVMNVIYERHWKHVYIILSSSYTMLLLKVTCISINSSVKDERGISRLSNANNSIKDTNSKSALRLLPTKLFWHFAKFTGGLLAWNTGYSKQTTMNTSWRHVEWSYSVNYGQE